MASEPQLRIGDTERDTAVNILREHLAAGRLDSDEFSERMGLALSARTQIELDLLFTDLPVDPNAVGGLTRWRAPRSREVNPTVTVPIFLIAFATMIFGIVACVASWLMFINGMFNSNVVTATAVSGVLLTLLGAVVARFTRSGHMLSVGKDSRAIRA
ncbi:MAG: DUF1707 domain-containing protein [Propionibacteriaceae bacterium]|jgi:uncharacterized membrane protein|nr:DUF1707 domain-containing protein [Propionibacteriaceae bacterium]